MQEKARIEGTQLTRASELTSRARALVGDLKARAAEAEQLRRVPKESIDLVRRAGLVRVIQSRKNGGHGLPMRAHVDVVSTIAEGCGSTAWVLGVAHAHSWMLSHFPAAAQQEVYGKDPDSIVAAVIAPRGKAVRQADGSYILNGHWPFASGSEHAAWLLLGAQVHDTSGALIEEADLLVPPSDLQFLDDWFVAGLQGTGSCSVAAKDLRVPAHRALPLGPFLESEAASFKAGDDDWPIRSQAVPVLALCITTSALGMARGALAEFRRVVPGKRLAYTNYVADEWVPTQVHLGHAAAMIHAAETVLYRIADDIDEHARLDRRMPLELRARIRVDCSHVVRLLMEAVDQLYTYGGAAGLSLKGSIQRAARDLHAVNMHGLLLFDTSAEVYGRVLLGKGSNTNII